MKNNLARNVFRNNQYQGYAFKVVFDNNNENVTNNAYSNFERHFDQLSFKTKLKDFQGFFSYLTVYIHVFNLSNPLPFHLQV